MVAPLIGRAALTAAQIIAKKRAADIAKKKVAKISAQEARKAASKMSERIGGSKPLARPKGSGNLPTRKPDFPKKTTVKQIPKKTPAQSAAEKRLAVFEKKKQLREGLKSAPKPKSTKRSPVFVTRSGKIAKRSEVEEVNARRQTKKPIKIENDNEPRKGLYEREFGVSPTVRELMDRRAIERANQLEKEARRDWANQVRESKINPRVVNPAKAEKDYQAERRAIEEVRKARELERQALLRRNKRGN